jgi:N-acetyl sugar amidotransferase
MDTSDTDITFDENGVSNHWYSCKERLQTEVVTGEAGLAKATEIAERIKAENRDRPYDCLIGVSGGVDSSTVAYWTRQLGLRALAVHMDNGWDSELAVANIETLLKTLDIDLHTEVLDWPEFRDLQRSFFFASVPNCEIPTDHAIVSTLFRLAHKLKIRHIISGSNVISEGVDQENLGHDAKDWTHIVDLHKRFGTRKLKNFPKLSELDLAKAILVDRVRFIPILNYLDYDREAAIGTLAEEMGWRDYGRKHGESTFTRFFQEYYLPEKFGFDKRRMHFSSLICAGQMTREEALHKLEEPMYQEDELEAEIAFVCKKLQFTEREFSDIMNARPKQHTDYRTGMIFKWAKSPFFNWMRNVATERS